MKTYILNFFLFSCSLLFAQDWESVNSGTDLQLNSISFGSSDVGFIGGNDSLLLKTMDGGNTWSTQSTNGIVFSLGMPDIIQVDFLDENLGFVTIGTMFYNGAVYKTTDGGANWAQELISICAPVKIYNFDELNAFAIGSGCFSGKDIAKKTNGLWANSVYLSWANDYLRAIDFYDDQYGMVAGDSGTVHRTFDAGLHWDTVPTFTNHTILDLKFVNDSTIYGTVDSLANALMISVDSGATWNPHMGALTFFYPSLKALTVTPYGELIAVGETSLNGQGFLIWGMEGGGFWNYQPVDHRLHGVTMASDSVAFAVGDSGLIVRNANMDLSIDETDMVSELSFYPNPVIDVLNIEEMNATISEVLIYDTHGKLLKRIQSDFNQIGLGDLSPGLYYISIEIDGQLVKRKMMKK